MRRLLCSALMLLAGCVSPARTDTAYEGKAVEALKEVRTAVETARLAAGLASDHRASRSYVSILLTEAEEAAAGAAGTFDSIQPPSEAAEELHEGLAKTLSNAIDVLRDLRIAARRGELRSLASIASPLEEIAAELERFVEAHE